MKISINDVELLTLSDVQKKVIANDIHEDALDNDLKRRIEYALLHKYEQSFKRLKEEWEPKLIKAGVKSFPTDPDEFANLVFSQPEYKSRKQRDS